MFWVLWLSLGVVACAASWLKLRAQSNARWAVAWRCAPLVFKIGASTSFWLPFAFWAMPFFVIHSFVSAALAAIGATIAVGIVAALLISGARSFAADAVADYMAQTVSALHAIGVGLVIALYVHITSAA